jgi:hypothetical protein
MIRPLISKASDFSINAFSVSGQDIKSSLDLVPPGRYKPCELPTNAGVLTVENKPQSTLLIQRKRCVGRHTTNGDSLERKQQRAFTTPLFTQPGSGPLCVTSTTGSLLPKLGRNCFTKGENSGLVVPRFRAHMLGLAEFGTRRS